ncbi:MAG: cbb3-type cytochrome c oxidase subunit I [Rhodospirillaceae bacterium]|nr:cbb3-type cytochrome c oxidase subunit I [Rhodospirillaceae bacterium]
MPRLNRLILAHLWTAFAAFGGALILGLWQMWVRSPFAAPLSSSENYFISVTAHGSAMGYVLTTFFIMGFGYFVAETALKRPVPFPRLAWAGFYAGIVGVALVVGTVVSGRATVLFTFYPPLTASPWFYVGLVLVVVSSWVWCALMLIGMGQWKRENPGKSVPLAMFATTANAVLWLWTTVGVAAEILFVMLPAAFGLTEAVDVGLTRTLFSWTLHAIVYFWLIPAYIAFYTMAPQKAGGRLYSDMMARISFVAFLIYGLPVGLHHLFMDPHPATGFKAVQMVLTVLVAVPTLLTVFTVCASMEIAGRLRGGKGLLGWVGALPWKEPLVLATGLSFFMLWFGGFGGLINMSYGMNAMVHNTSWVTAHFHMIFGGSVVIMYFAIAYEIWPKLTGRAAPCVAHQRVQLWSWAIGMMILSLPWHLLGMFGQWRRVAQFDYSDPTISWWAPWMTASLIGGAILVASGALFIWNLARFHIADRAQRLDAAPMEPMQYAVALHPGSTPAALNGFRLWNILVLVLMTAAYALPIAHSFIVNPPHALVHRVNG